MLGKYKWTEFFFQSIFHRKGKHILKALRNWITTRWIIIGKYLDDGIIIDNTIYFFVMLSTLRSGNEWQIRLKCEHLGLSWNYSVMLIQRCLLSLMLNLETFLAAVVVEVMSVLFYLFRTDLCV